MGDRASLRCQLSSQIGKAHCPWLNRRADPFHPVGSTHYLPKTFVLHISHSLLHIPAFHPIRFVASRGEAPVAARATLNAAMPNRERQDPIHREDAPGRGWLAPCRLAGRGRCRSGGATAGGLRRSVAKRPGGVARRQCWPLLATTLPHAARQARFLRRCRRMDADPRGWACVRHGHARRTLSGRA